MESDVAAESVVESVIRGGKEAYGNGEGDESVLADESVDIPKERGFGEKSVSDDVDDEDTECQAKPGSVHSVASDDRKDLDYLGNKERGNLVLKLLGGLPFPVSLKAFFYSLLSLVTDDEIDGDYVPSSSVKSQGKKKLYMVSICHLRNSSSWNLTAHATPGYKTT